MITKLAGPFGFVSEMFFENWTEVQDNIQIVDF
jgi:hypothetical protein